MVVGNVNKLTKSIKAKAYGEQGNQEVSFFTVQACLWVHSPTLAIDEAGLQGCKQGMVASPRYH